MSISSFVNGLNNLDYDKVPEKLLEVVFRKDYSLKSLGVSARKMQSWYENGLLPYEVLKSKKHTFNFVHLIWLFIVDELRKFGVPLKMLKYIREQLLKEYTLQKFIKPLNADEAINVLESFNAYEPQKEKEFRAWFERYKLGDEVVSLEDLFEKDIIMLSDLLVHLVLLMMGTERYFITIRDNGDVTFYASDEVKDLSTVLGYSTRIVIPLNSFFLKYVEDINNLEFLKEIGMINKLEGNLLKTIHSGDFDLITIKFKDKKVKTLEYSKNIKKADIGRIGNIIARKQYQHIVLKTEDGDIRYANVTKKVNIK